MELTFHKTTLGNGLNIIGEHNPKAQSFAAGYFVATGARDESPEVSGVSHFLEHMMFKGTPRRSAEDINREFDELGANYNAFTSEERTVYYGAVLPERSGKLLDLLSDMMRPALRQKDFDVEKKVILEEIAMYEDRPNVKVFDKGNQHYYNGHPLGNSILGTTQSISDLSCEQMLGYFENRYSANNLFLCLTGNYSWSEVVSQISELSQNWQPQATERNYAALTASQGQHKIFDEKVKRFHAAAYAPGFSAQSSERYTAAILANCIGGGVGSRLYWALVDKGLADSASFWHDGADGLGTFLGYLSTDLNQAQKVVRVFKEILLEVQAKGLNQNEWQRAQRKFATTLTLRGETSFGRLISLGTHYQYKQDYASVQDIIDRVMVSKLENGLEILAAKPFDSLFTVTLESST